MSWSREVATPGQARRALADPGDSLDLRVAAPLEPAWEELGFRELVPGELVRPLDVALPSPQDTAALGARLAAALRPGDLVVLTGPLGAGKTALTQGLGAALGVSGRVTSPTFVLARVHRGPIPLVHADAYRLRDAGSGTLDDLDLDADLPSSVVVVEWGEGLVEGLSDSRLEVRVSRPEPGAADEDPAGASLRRATVRAYGPRWAVLSR